MDLMYSRYSDPIGFMNIYIRQGRFAEFVDSIIGLRNKRLKEETEKDAENKLWLAYLMSPSDKPYEEWKKDLSKSPENPTSYSMTDEQVEEVKGKARDILGHFNM